MYATHVLSSSILLHENGERSLATFSNHTNTNTNTMSMTLRLPATKRIFLRHLLSKTTATTTSSQSSAGAKRWHGGPKVADAAPTVNIVFLQGETRKEVSAKVGESFLQTAHRHDIDLEGACEGT
jgi:hypothetical protein